MENKNYVIIKNDNGEPVAMHPQTNAGQVYDFANAKWLNQTVGILADATTTNKSNLVAMINEVNAKGGGSVDPDEVAEIVEDLTGNLNSEVSRLAKKSVDKISLLEYEDLKVAISGGYDWKPVFQHIVDEYDGKITIEVPYNENPYLLGSTVLIPDGVTFNITSDSHETEIKAANGFVGSFMFEFKGGFIDVRNLTFRGNSLDGVSALGATSGNYGGYRFEKLRFYNLEFGINFGGSSEFPLGGYIEDIWAFEMYTCAIKLATDTTPLTGQSCHEFHNIRVNNFPINGKTSQSAQSLTVTEGSTSDALSWSASGMKEYGWVIMRRPKGVEHSRGENWVHLTYSTGTSFTASKPNGTEWDYAVVRRTVGMHIKHLKGVTFGILQAEYFATGLLCEKGTGITVGSYYNEWRGNTTGLLPCAAGDGIYVIDTIGFTLNSAWQEGGKSVIRLKYSSGTRVDGVRGNNLTDSIVFYEGHNYNTYHEVGALHPSGTTPVAINDDGSAFSKNYMALNPKHGVGKTGENAGQELVINAGNSSRFKTQYRGTNEGTMESNNEGSSLKVNKLQISTNNKNLMVPFNNNQHTITNARNTATDLLRMSYNDNYGSVLKLEYTLEVYNGSSQVQYFEGGEIRLLILKPQSGSIVTKVEKANVLSSGTESIVTFTSENSTSSTVLVKFAVDSALLDSGGNARLRLMPIVNLRSNNSSFPTVTQL